jgi:hypothetical protein
MSVKPTLLKDLRRTAIHQHQSSIGNGSYNRWEVLDPRARTFSAGKIPRTSDTDKEQAPKTPKLDANTVFSQLSAQDSTLKEVGTLVQELDTLNDNPDTPKDPRISCIVSIIKLLVKSNENISSVVLDSLKLKGPEAPKGKTNAIPIPGFRKGGNTAAPRDVPEISPDDRTRNKIKQSLKDAEKKTVIFNLDLGTAPMMNKSSISRKVTLTLGSTVKEGNHDYDIKDAEEVLDDILSCSKLEFLGNTTKQFFNKRNLADKRNGKMYTVPVRMDFRDKETRFQAETHLRKICGASCSVPYPRKLRTMLGDLVKEGKKTHPNSFIRTKVNVDSLTIEAHAKTEGGWLDLGLIKHIPLNILDNNPLSFSNSQAQPTGLTQDAAQMEDEDEEASLS